MISSDWDRHPGGEVRRDVGEGARLPSRRGILTPIEKSGSGAVGGEMRLSKVANGRPRRAPTNFQGALKKQNVVHVLVSVLASERLRRDGHQLPTVPASVVHKGFHRVLFEYFRFSHQIFPAIGVLHSHFDITVQGNAEAR